jgi:eukaryotic-like serine/threonine-protein kinase
MTPEYWKMIERVLDAVLESDPDQWSAIVDHFCGDEKQLRHEVETLLRHYRGAQSFLQSSAGEVMLSLTGDETSDRDDDITEIHTVDKYRIIHEIAHGGMGRVFLAERADGEYTQRVALKLLHSFLDSENMQNRLRIERQILASLNHPNIARLLDGGVVASEFGRGSRHPYLVMEYVEGISIKEYCNEKHLPVPERLKLFIKAAEAVQHAHRNLVIHCDIKPSNILVTEEGEVKLLDFGISRLLSSGSPSGEEFSTRTLRQWMTPEYAAPEQVKGERATTSTDVYQLGVLLYVLLTGRHPFELERENLHKLEQAILETDPIKPSSSVQSDTLRKTLQGDIDAMILKTLRKEPDERYASVEAMIDDIRRYIAGLPVTARRGSLAYRSKKFIKRQKWTVAAMTTIVLLVTGYVITLTVSSDRVNRALDQTSIALVETEQALNRAESLREFLIDLFHAAEPNRPRDQLPTTEELLALGARRALDPQSAPPEERFDMLVTIGRVYAQQDRYQQASTLLDAAVELARDHQTQRPEDLAIALDQRAWVYMRMGRLNEAEVHFLEAESVLNVTEDSWDIFARVRANRGWVEYLKGNRTMAQNMLEPLYAQMRERDNVNLSVRYMIINSLASVYHQIGDIRSAADLRIEGSELAKRIYGPQSLSYAIDLANSSNVQRALGRFDIAEEQIRHAITLYDRIFGETPTGVRAVAQRNLARTLLVTGRFDESLAAMEKSAVEFAHIRGRDIGDDEAYFYYKGWLLTQMHRWEEAEEKLFRAHSLYASMSEPPIRWLTNVEALLLLVLSRQYKTVRAESILKELDERLNGRIPTDQRERALVHEARAICHFASGRLDIALQEVKKALEADTSPGRVVRRSDRKILYAQILAAMGERRQVERELDKAKEVFLDVGLADHPLFPDIEALRRELFTDRPNATENRSK